jgi:DNA-binding response OmpR family regulator
MSLIQSVKKAPLLLRTWFLMLCIATVIAALLHIYYGFHRITTYQNKLVECVESTLRQHNNALAASVKNDSYEFVNAQLNTIEYKCAPPHYDSFGITLHSAEPQQASFFWLVERDGVEKLRLGKSLLKGPVERVLYPLSLWSDEGGGEYWVGSIKLELYLGDFLKQELSVGWTIFLVQLGLFLVLSVCGLVLGYFSYVRRSIVFMENVQSDMPTAHLREVLDKKDDELSMLWRVFLDMKEGYDDQIFSLESETRSAQDKIAKLERGSFGQSTSMEKVSLDIKTAAASLLHYIQDSSSPNSAAIDVDSVRSYLAALMSVSANLHERALIESGEVSIAEHTFNIRVMIAQVYLEFIARFDARHIKHSFDVDKEISGFVVGDPEKIKRIMRNAFKRVLLDSDIDTITFKVLARPNANDLNRVYFELSALPSPVSLLRGDEKKRRRPPKDESGVTVMLDKLCSVMGADWTSNLGVDGDLRQSVEFTLPPVNEAVRLRFRHLDRSLLATRRAVMIEFNPELSESLPRLLGEKLESIEIVSDAEHFLDRLTTSRVVNNSPDLVILSDSVKSMNVLDLVAQLRLVLSPQAVIAVLVEYPQIGEAKVYQEVGANIYLPHSHINTFLVDMLAWVFANRNVYDNYSDIVTWYAILDQSNDSEQLSLPNHLYPMPQRSVLFVGQELTSLEIARQRCQAHNARFIHYDKGFDGVASFKNELFDLIILDESVEDVDCVSLLQILRRLEQARSDSLTTPIVVLGANGSRSEQKLYLNSGATELVQKPMFGKQFALVFAQYLK